MQQSSFMHSEIANKNNNIVISIVVPLYNEENVLPIFHERLAKTLDIIDMCSEIIYINDGSTDRSLEILGRICEKDPRVAILDLSRNFGKEIAMTAGLDYSTGDVAIVIDSDLQDPPELIPEFISHWSKGYDVVYGQRIHRDGESLIKKATAYGFYRLMQNIGRVKIPADTGDFRLLSRRAINSLKKIREQHRFMKGLFTWIGFPQIAVPYKRDARYAGESKWNYWKLWNFAIEGITSFTVAPLKIATYIGLITAISAFVYGFIIILKTIIFGNPVPGYPSLMVVILFLGGIQLMAIGILGEYVGRMFDETKNRPLYITNSYKPAATIKSLSKNKSTNLLENVRIG